MRNVLQSSAVFQRVEEPDFSERGVFKNLFPMYLQKGLLLKGKIDHDEPSRTCEKTADFTDLPQILWPQHGLPGRL